jgi:hypothetical protein
MDEPQQQSLFVAYPRRPLRPGEALETNPDGSPRIKATRPTGRGLVRMCTGRMSLLNYNFNKLFTIALNARKEGPITHWAMQHDDVLPEVNWADRCIDEMDRVNADVMSVVLPIKDERGLTSTGARNRWDGDMLRLTMAEVHQKLPATFALEDLAAGGILKKIDRGDHLLINTGLWVVRFDRPWVERFPGFRCHDEIRRKRVGDDGSGEFEAICLSEDWSFSEWADDHGLRVFATTKIKAAHCHGEKQYPNDVVWGTCATDPGGA